MLGGTPGLVSAYPLPPPAPRERKVYDQFSNNLSMKIQIIFHIPKGKRGRGYAERTPESPANKKKGFRLFFVAVDLVRYLTSFFARLIIPRSTHACSASSSNSPKPELRAVALAQALKLLIVEIHRSSLPGWYIFSICIAQTHPDTKAVFDGSEFMAIPKSSMALSVGCLLIDIFLIDFRFPWFDCPKKFSKK